MTSVANTPLVPAEHEHGHVPDRARAGTARARRPQVKRAAIVVLLVVGVLFPFYFSDYADFQMARVFSLAIAVLSLNLLAGYTGQISVGHGALMGIGAYTTIILVTKSGLPYPLAVVCGAVLCFAVGLMLGLPTLRIRGLYLALATLAFALVFPPLVKRFPELTGGVLGLPFIPPEAPAGLPLSSAQWLYLLSFAVLVACLFGMHNLVRGRVGRSLGAIRHNELMAAANGVPVGRVKTLVFATSAALAGLGGGLYQLVLGSPTPDTYLVALSIAVLTASVIGGVRSLLGAVVGAAFIVYVPDYTADLGEGAPQLIYAAVLLLFIYFLSGGVSGALRRAGERLRNRLAAPARAGGGTGA